MDDSMGDELKQLMGAFANSIPALITSFIAQAEEQNWAGRIAKMACEARTALIEGGWSEEAAERYLTHLATSATSAATKSQIKG